MRLSPILTGQWKGTFTLGKEYGDLEGDVTEFMMFLNEENGVIEGKCFEMTGKLVSSNSDLALITGFFKDDTISFIKKYNHATYIDENGNIQDDFFRPSQEINYTGIYNQNSKRFEGDWEIVERTELDGEGLIEYFSSGTWQMKKESD